MPITQCPSDQQLRDFGLGKLSNVEIDSISSHISSCEQCEAKVDSIPDSNDWIVASLRAKVESSDSQDEAELKKALGEVVNMFPSIGSQPSSASRSSSTEQLPEKVGAYKILEKIGEGGMGSVYKAVHSVLGKLVALKLLRSEKLENGRAVERFYREIEAVGKLDHSNIVRATDAGQADGIHFLAMDLVDGANLSEISAAHGPLSTKDACEVVRQAAIGLQHAHEHNLIHRDVKPSNLMLTADGTVKLLDLGLARLGADIESDSELTRSGIVIGTVDYIAPEQVKNSKKVDIRADIYSLGCTLFKLLTGHVIYPHSSYGSPYEKLQAHVSAEIPNVAEMRDGIPPALSVILKKMLSKNPADRFASPAGVVRALEPFTKGCNLPPLLAPRQPKEETAAPSDKSNSTVFPSASMLTDTDADERPEVKVRPASGKKKEVPPKSFVAPQPAVDENDSGSGNRRKIVMATAAGAAALLLGIVIYWQTDKGTVKITVSDPKTKVTIDGDEAEIDFTKPVRLRVGKHTLKAIVDGVEIDSKDVIVVRNGEHSVDFGGSVKIELVDNEIAKSDAGDSPKTSTKSITDSKGSDVSTPKPQPKSMDTQHPTAKFPVYGNFAENDELRRRVADNRDRPADDPAVVALRNDLVAQQQKLAGSPAAVDVGRLMSHLAWPIDDVRRESIPEYEIEQLGNGLENPRGMAMVVGLLGTSRLKHWGPVQQVHWTPDGRTLFALSQYNVRSWDTTTGQQLSSIFFSSQWSGRPGISPDGALLAAGMYGNEGMGVKVLDSRTGDVKLRLNMADLGDNYHYFPSFSADGQRLAVAASGGNSHDIGSLTLWNLQTSEREKVFQKESTLDAVFSPDGKTIASGDLKGTLTLWDVESGKSKWSVTNQNIEFANADMAFSPDGKSIVVSFNPKETNFGVRSYNVADGSVDWVTHPYGGPAHRFAFRPNGKQVFVAGGDNEIWNSADGKDFVRLQGHRKANICGEYSPDGEILATGTNNGGIRFWNATNGQEIKIGERSGHGNAITALKIHDDGSLLATGGWGRAIVWDVATQNPVHSTGWTSAGWSTDFFDFHPSEPKLLITSNGSLHPGIWNYEKGDKIDRYSVGSPGNFWGAYFDKHRNHFYLAGMAELADFDLRTEQTENRIDFKKHADGTRSEACTMHPNGKSFAAATRDGLVMTFDLPSGKLRAKFRTHEHGGLSTLTYSPDGKILAIGSQHLVLFNLETNERIKNPEGIGGSQVRFSPDGRYIASAGTAVADLRTGKRLFLFQQGHVHDLTFTPDSRHLITANANGTAYIFRLRERNEGNAADLVPSDANKEPQVAASLPVKIPTKPATNQTAEPDNKVSNVAGFEELSQRVAASKDKPADDPAVIALRKDLLVQQQKLAGQPAVVEVGRLMSQLAWPIDDARRESISEYEIEQLGNGTENPRGMAMVVGVLGDSRMKHWSRVRQIHPFPDGKSLLVLDQSRARVWDTKSGKHLASFEFHTEWRSRSSLSPDGSLLAIGLTEYDRRGVYLLDSKTGEAESHFDLGDNRSFYHFATSFSPDGQRLAIAALGGGQSELGSLSVWNIQTGEQEKLLQEKATRMVAFSPDGKTIASGDDDGTMTLWDAETGEAKLSISDQNLSFLENDFTFAPDGKSILVSRNQPDGQFVLRLYNIADGSVNWETDPGFYHPTSLHFSPDGKTFFVARRGAYIGNAANGKRIVSLDTRGRPVMYGSFSLDGKSLFTGNYYGSVRTWNTVTGKEVFRHHKDFHGDSITALAVRNNESTIATASEGHLALWDLADQKIARTVQWNGNTSIATQMEFHPSKPLLISDCFGSYWNFETSNQLTHFDTGISGTIRGAFFDRERNHFYLGGSEELVDFDLRTEQTVNRIACKQNSQGKGLNAYAMHPNRKSFAASTVEGDVTIYDLPSGEAFSMFKAHFNGNVGSLAYSPDGKVLAVASQHLVLIDLATKEQIPTPHGVYGQHACFSPDGKYVASGQSPVSVTDLQTGERVFQFRFGTANDMVFTHDSRHLITANANGTAYIFRLRELGE